MPGNTVNTIRERQTETQHRFETNYGENQKLLPKIPVAPLEDTLKRYLGKLEALLNQDDFEEARKVCEYFQATDGPVIHQLLEEYNETVPNFLEECWRKSYLDATCSVVCNVNPIFLFEDDLSPISHQSQARRASALVCGAAEFITQLRKGQLPVDKWRGTAMCMLQYQYLFGTSRLPPACTKDSNDTIAVCNNSTHIVIISRGQFYWLDILQMGKNESYSAPHTQETLTAALESIIADSTRHPYDEVSPRSLGVATSDARDSWGITRSKIENLSSGNLDTLQLIDDALFILCLDETEPKTTSEAVANMLHGSYSVEGESCLQTGTSMNRWYDKLQLIVCKNGKAGINFEHTMVDGHTVLRFASDIFTDTITKFAKTINGTVLSIFEREGTQVEDQINENGTTVSGQGGRPLALYPRKLEWELNGEILERLSLAEMKLGDTISQTEVCVEEFDMFGKLSIVSKLSASPDAVVQLSILTAYIRLYKESPNIYESVQTKVFLHGRTDCCRTTCPASVTFAKCLGKVDKDESQKLFRDALSHQNSQVKDSARALGPERQLFAMYYLWYKKNKFRVSRRPTVFESENNQTHSAASGNASSSSEKAICNTESDGATITKVPGIFRQKGWEVLNHSTISTSNCGNPSLRCFGFGPTCPEGFGIGYIIRDSNITLTVTSKRRQTNRFAKAISVALKDIMALAEEPTKAENTLETADDSCAAAKLLGKVLQMTV